MENGPQQSQCDETAGHYEDMADVVALRISLSMPTSPAYLDQTPSGRRMAANDKAFAALDALQGPVADEMLSRLDRVNGGCETCPLQKICEEIQADRAP